MSLGSLDLTGSPVLWMAGNNPLKLGCDGSGALKLAMTSGTLKFPISNPAAGTAATTVTTGDTIDTTKFWQRVTTATGDKTGMILEAGTMHGQLLLVTVDKDAVGKLTFDAVATSNVGGGTGCIILQGAGRFFIWDATDACWVNLSDT